MSSFLKGLPRSLSVKCFSLDAAKFVNDDYVLACSLENGQVLFLHGYHDPSPVTVDTNLQSNYRVTAMKLIALV